MIPYVKRSNLHCRKDQSCHAAKPDTRTSPLSTHQPDLDPIPCPVSRQKAQRNDLHQRQTNNAVEQITQQAELTEKQKITQMIPKS